MEKECSVMTVDKSVANEFFNLLGLKGMKCKSCGCKITGKNFGIIHKDYTYCGNAVCIMDFFETLDAAGLEYDNGKIRKKKEGK